MQLHAAAARGDLDGIKYALEHGTLVDAHNDTGETALIFALAQARAFERRDGPKVNLATISLLLDAGASLEAADKLDQTPIHHAVQIAEPALVDLLITRKANWRRETSSKYSVMLHACYQPYSKAKIQIMEMLAALGSDLNNVSQYGEFPLGACLYLGDFDGFNRLHQLGADLSPLHWTDLHRAVAFNQLADVKRLATSPAAINAKAPGHDLSPWLLSICIGDLGKIHLLAEAGADLVQTGRCGDGALHLAAKYGRANVIRWLINLGATVETLTDFAETPLHCALAWDRCEAAAALLEASANPAAGTHVQSQPVHEARSLPALQLLAARGADVNAISGSGEWPLKSAAEDNDIARIVWLLDRGAEVDRTSTGETALHTAVRRDSREAVKLLLEAGANPNAQDVDGWTALFGAASRETICMLLESGARIEITDQIGKGAEYWIKDPILKAALKGR